MNYLRKCNRLILFLLAFIVTLQIVLVFRTEQMIKEIKGIEPVVIERVEYVEVPVEVPVEIPVEVPVEPTVVAPTIDCRLSDELQQMVFEKSNEYEIDFAFTMAVIFKESSFYVDADSGCSVGLMQINRINHEWLSEELGLTDFWDPEQNVTAGLYILNYLFEKYGDPHQVLMAYNMGEAGARKQWNKGIYTSAYSEGVLQTADKYRQEIEERANV